MRAILPRSEKMRERVLFLDFDGPMIPMRAWPIQGDRGYDTFDPVAAATVKRVLDSAGAKIVVSSSWRISGYDVVVDVMERAGLDRSYLHDDWKTECIASGPTLLRKKEIALWLSKHPEVQDYVILDDEDVGLPNQVKVTFEDGLTMEASRQLFKLFNAEM